MKVLVFGGTGFIGKALAPYLRHQKHTVEIISRHPRPGDHYWDPETKTLDPKILEKSDVIINLSGENIFGIGTKDKLKRIQNSRLLATELITNTLKTLSFPPQLYIGASAIGYYGDRGDEPLNETSSPGNSFFSALCDQVETIANTIVEKNIRVVHGRFGIVLNKDGGALSKMLPIFQMGLGGKLGNGRQFMSWIALDDFLRAISFIIDTKSLYGPVNLTSPYPVTNQEFTRSLAERINRPAFLNVPQFVIDGIFGPMASLFLASAAVYPKALLDAGFTFDYPNITSALKQVI